MRYLSVSGGHCENIILAKEYSSQMTIQFSKKKQNKLEHSFHFSFSYAKLENLLFTWVLEKYVQFVNILKSRI